MPYSPERGQRMSEVAQKNECPQCKRRAAIARRRDRYTGGIVLRCRWCGYMPDGQVIYYGRDVR